MTHVMMDLETLGKRPGDIVLSIGAVVFTPTGVGVDGQNSRLTFYRNINVISSLLEGFTWEDDTLDWWRRQDPNAKTALLSNPLPLRTVVTDFNSWFREVEGVEIWANGPSFDVTIWEAICRKLDMEVPWQFDKVRDCRTAYFIGNFNPKTELGRVGVYHNAVDDAMFQAIAVQHALKLAQEPEIQIKREESLDAQVSSS